MDSGFGYYLGYLMSKWNAELAALSGTDMVWLGIGLAGQLMFMMRFVVQWVSSERAKRSVMPVSFWYFSLVGGITVLAYGLYRVEPVIILGQLPGTLIYLRNLRLIQKERRQATP